MLISKAICKAALTVLAASFSVCASAQSAETAQDSHYPNVWYRPIYTSPRISNPNVSSFYYDTSSQDYDAIYLRDYVEKSAAQGGGVDLIYDSVGFFSGDIQENASNADFAAAPQYGFVRSSYVLTLENGRTISLKNLDSRASGSCPQSVNHYLEMTESDGTISARRSVLYRSPIEARLDISSRCASEIDSHYTRNIGALSGKMVKIKDDDSFLFAGPGARNGANLILRMKTDLTVADECHIPNLLIVDTEEIERFFNFEDGGYQQLQDKVLGYFTTGRNEKCHDSQ